MYQVKCWKVTGTCKVSGQKSYCAHAQNSMHEPFPSDMAPKEQSPWILVVIMNNQHPSVLNSLLQDRCGFGDIISSFKHTLVPIAYIGCLFDVAGQVLENHKSLFLV